MGTRLEFFVPTEEHDPVREGIEHQQNREVLSHRLVNKQHNLRRKTLANNALSAISLSAYRKVRQTGIHSTTEKLSRPKLNLVALFTSLGPHGGLTRSN